MLRLNIIFKPFFYLMFSSGIYNIYTLTNKLSAGRAKYLLTGILLCFIFTGPGFAAIPTYRLDTISIKTYDKLVSRYRYDKPDSAMFFAQKGMELAKKLNDLDGQAMMLNQLGMIDNNAGEYDASKKKFWTALSLYTQTHNTKGMAAENIRLGVVEMRQGSYDRAIGYFLEALTISEHNGNKLGLLEANLTLGEAYMYQNKFDMALKYYQRAEGYNNQLPVQNLSFNMYNDFGNLFISMGRFNDAKLYLNKGLSLKEINKPQYQGLNITLINTLATVYAKEGNKAKSIELQKTALVKARKISNYVRELQTLNGLAATYGHEQIKEALFYNEQAINLARSKDDHKQEVFILNNTADLYKYQGKYQDAYALKEQQYNLADKYFYKEMSKQIASLQAAYELNQSKARVQELSFTNQQQKLERKIMLSVIIGALILLVIVAFFFYKTRQLNGLLNETNASLQESNHVKDKLFSVLGHDLRSPFVSVINLLEIAGGEDITVAERNELFAQLSKTSNASLETLSNLLKWGEMQIKGVRLNQTTFTVKDIIERNIILLSEQAHQKAITVNNEIDGTVKVFADADHFDFVIRNLISNAIKFSFPDGNVAISALQNNVNNTVTITVKDKGIGIPADQIDQIFNISNISNKGTNNEPGTSLGLLLCKEFIELNNGTIQVESAPGKGSIFSFSLNS
jgi:signal transduction histidine kinase